MTTLLIIINVAVFLLMEINAAYIHSTIPGEYLTLSRRGISRGYIWQFLTFQFLHAGGFHLVFNLLGLYIFGHAVEDAIGRKHFLRLYLASGVLGGLVQTILFFVFPRVYGSAVVGASAGLFGLIAAFAALDPHREILLFFVLPMRAIHFLWIAIGVSIFYIFVPVDNVAHGAHLGGIAGGFFYIRKVFIQGRYSFEWPRFRLWPRRNREVVPAGAKRSFWAKPKATEPEIVPSAEFISREVDPILDKISAHGIQSLTERERKILESARSKMARR